MAPPAGGRKGRPYNARYYGLLKHGTRKAHRTAFLFVQAVAPDGVAAMTTRTAITLLNNAETAELLGIKPNTLEIWRTFWTR